MRLQIPIFGMETFDIEYSEKNYSLQKILFLNCKFCNDFLIKDTINPYYCLLKNANVSIKISNDKIT